MPVSTILAWHWPHSRWQRCCSALVWNVRAGYGYEILTGHDHPSILDIENQVATFGSGTQVLLDESVAQMLPALVVCSILGALASSLLVPPAAFEVLDRSRSSES